MIETLLTFSQISTTVLIAVVPLWYPEHSCFTRNAKIGVERLLDCNKTRTVPGEGGEELMQKYAVIHKGETGFEEVHKTIKGNIDLGIEPTSFELVHHRPDMSGAVEVDEDIKKLEQVYLKAENEQGESVRVIDSPRVEIDRVLQLTSLREWVKSHSRYRSHLIVTGLSLTWGTLSTTLLLQ